MSKNANDFITEMVKRKLPPTHPAIDPNADMLEHQYCDSLGFLEIIAAVEEEFGIQVDFSDLAPEEFTSIAGLCRQVNLLLPTASKS